MESIKEITDAMENLTFDEKIKYLKTNRCRLLCEIHKKQQLLDQIDYLLVKIKEEHKQ